MLEAGIPFESVIDMTYPQIEMLQEGGGKTSKMSLDQFKLMQRAKELKEANE